jgi:hypothetical protein
LEVGIGWWVETLGTCVGMGVDIGIITCYWTSPLSLLMTDWTTIVNWSPVYGVCIGGITGCSKTERTYQST